MSVEQQQINQAYASLCTKLGDLETKKLFLNQQISNVKQQIIALDKKIKQLRAASNQSGAV